MLTKFSLRQATHPSIATLSEGELDDFAALLKQVLVKFDNLWRMPFPYVMPLHQAPTDGGDYSAFIFTLSFTRHCDDRIFLNTYGAGNGGGNFLWTLSRKKAVELRSLSDIHYKHVLQEQP